jgi:uncharacterized cupredoxin-like copper-binding protein
VRRLLALALVLSGLPACSEGGGREIRVEMFEMGYRPSRIEVAPAETVTFVVENTGAATHELFIGDEEEQEARDALLAAGGVPPDPSSVVVAFDDSGELTYTFGERGELLFGCHIIGHYAAGMVGTIVVG